MSEVAPLLRPDEVLAAKPPSHLAPDAPSRGWSERFRDALLIGEEITALPPLSPLVEGVLDLDTTVLFYGPSGAGKSFVALSLALSVDTGRSWFGHRVTAGPVLYIVAEGVSGLGPRLAAWEHHHGVTGGANVYWLPMAVNLLERDQVSGVVEVARELRPNLVLVDTLARCIVGGDENSSKDMGRAVEAVEQVRQATGACVAMVHHTGKDEGAGARGSSALKAAVATELEVRGRDGAVTVRVTKQRDRADGEVIHLRLVEVGSSAVVTATEAGSNSASEAQLLTAIWQSSGSEGLPSSILLKVSELPERTYYRALKTLRDQGVVVNVGTEERPRWAAKTQGDA